MSPLADILSRIWRNQRTAMRRALALSVTVALFGIALLGLSGWFIVAAGAAGLAGLGAVFDVFRPSAGVRFLAIGRTASRYGERLLTHDATLKALASLRVDLLAGVSGADFALLSRLRGGQALNRLTADVDALDGLAIRLAFPALAGLLAALTSFAALWLLVAPVMAVWTVGTTVIGGLVTLWAAGRAAQDPAAEAEARHQALRAGVIDHLRGRQLLAGSGKLPESRNALLAGDARARSAQMRQSRIEWRSAAALQIVAALTLAGTLYLAGNLVLAGQIAAAQAALAVFAALALGELAAGLQRGVAEVGRMRDAASRVAPLLRASPAPAAPESKDAPGLQLSGLSVAARAGLPPVINDLDLSVDAGEVVALTGPSGRGKSVLLNCIAGLVPQVAGSVRLGGRLGYLPQRPALMAGSIREALALAAPDAGDAAKRQVLEVSGLDISLDHRLGEGGSGLSGGQARRLALARVLIQRPDVLLLDEPTEGLDRPLARSVLTNLRGYLPDAAILIAAHRLDELEIADRVVSLGQDESEPELRC